MLYACKVRLTSRYYKMFKAILAKQANRLAVMQALEVSMQQYIDLLEKDFDSTVEHWKNKPAVEKEVKLERAPKFSVVGRVWIKDKIYYFISKGTRVRYATMSSDFKSKTSPSRIKSRPGAGRVIYVSKRKPRPGIKARNFNIKIAKWRYRNFVWAGKRAMKNAALASGHAI